MNLAAMRTKFRARTSGLGDQLEDSVIDELFNRWYQFVIPADIGGDLTEGVWTQETAYLVTEYAYPSYVIAPRADACWISSQKTDFDVDPTVIDVGPFFLDTETDRAVFEISDRYANTSATGARPTVVLFSEKKMTVHPPPDEAYFITIPCRMGPSTALDSAGIANELHAMAVVTGSCHEYLTDKEDLSGASREGASYEFYKEKLQKHAHGKPRHRRPARSF